MFSIRVDTGGTFTDCWGRSDEDSSPRLVKVLSSGRLRVGVEEWLGERELRLDLPASWTTGESFFTGYKLESGDRSALVLSYDPSSRRAVLSHPLPPSDTVDLFTREEAPILGARLLTGTPLDRPFPPLDFRLATTRGTNALLERKGAPVALFITAGFGDLPVIRDQRRRDLFAAEHRRPAPLFETVHEVDERLSPDGEILTPLEFGSNLEAAARRALDGGARVAAVALLHAYLNPEHERLLRERLLDIGFDHVSISSELAPLAGLLSRTETTVTNAYLQPVMQQFLDHVASRLDEESRLLTMTSAGGLETADAYAPKDSLLSGPAGGVSGAVAIAEELGRSRILTFDMGGTSTDVARYDDGFQYRFEQVVGDARLLSPALQIETVASGGGSICQWKDGGLRVGPDSAGADPGPACYGRGGPLTVTDVNLLLGRIDPDNFGIPLSGENRLAAERAAVALQHEAGLSREEPDRDFLEGLLEIAVEQMADAIRAISVRDGADPSDYALLAFGGAGPLHACAIAGRLGISEVIVPGEAGLLSAFGLDRAGLERFAERQVLLPGDHPDLPDTFTEVDREAVASLREIGAEGQITRRLAEVRLAGQDATLSVDITPGQDPAEPFREKYRATFGYDPPSDRAVEIVSYRAIAGTGRTLARSLREEVAPGLPESTGLNDAPNPVGSAPSAESLPFHDRARLAPSRAIAGPAVIQDPFSTLYLPDGWSARSEGNGALVVSCRQSDPGGRESSRPEQVRHELFRHRFDNIVVEMGNLLQRSAVSTNVKERADFSCALLDGGGRLITSAPHIPVHLGALGLCVRMVAERIDFRPGDTVITNHPGVGGSHLPDVTLITPLFGEDRGRPVAFVANRAHHAEIGGRSPGSMPPDAASLAEEGIVIAPTHLIREDQSRFDEIERLLTSGPWPTRNLRDNLSDLHAQLAANRRGAELFSHLLHSHGEDRLADEMAWLASSSHHALAKHLDDTDFREAEAVEELDDGAEIRVRITRESEILAIDFAGAAASHPANLSATPAIVRSAVLYVLRLWTASTVPLNEGMLDSVEIRLPRCFLNPAFPDDPAEAPAVVGGNVETSQRLVDTLVRALGIQACSQGTMNNLLFGDENFGYYETIGGGAGAGDGYHGASGIHTHMTNTAITDPEILEQRYPVRLHRFSLRPGSGGEGRWRGGDGIIREIEFLRPLEISLLTQHRRVRPFGLAGGGDGQTGAQRLDDQPLDGIASARVEPGQRLVIETPGGGGYGPAHQPPETTDSA